MRALEAVPAAAGTALAGFRGLSTAVSASPGSGTRERLTRAFGDLDRDDRLKTVLITGRAIILSSGTPAFVGLSRRTANPFVVHTLSRQLDAFSDLIAAADAPWPQRIERMNAVDRWPYGFASKSDGGSFGLRNFTKAVAVQVRDIRCARLIASPQPLTLVDPFSGRRLEPSQCHL
jgi:hypothetical protein